METGTDLTVIEARQEPASTVLFDHKRGRIGAPEAELSVVVSPLVSLMVDQVSSFPVVVFLTLFLVERVDKKYVPCQ